MHGTLNIAHRGFSGVYPENTMLAFKKAVEAGCDGVECDIHLTRDNIAVICHDPEIDRTTDGTGYIHDYTYDELRRFDAGIKKGKEFMGQRIPTLDEFLEYFSDKNMLVNVELKTDSMDYEGIEKILIEKTYRYKLEKHMIISSFNHYSIRKCLAIDSSIKTGLLYDNNLFEPEKYAALVGADALHPYYKTLDEEIVKKAHKSSILINAWTVNQKEDMKYMLKLGIDGIITNYPDRLKSIMRK